MEIWFNLNVTASLIWGLMVFIAVMSNTKEDGHFAFVGGVFTIFTPVSWVVYFIAKVWL